MKTRTLAPAFPRHPDKSRGHATVTTSSPVQSSRGIKNAIPGDISECTDRPGKTIPVRRPRPLPARPKSPNARVPRKRVILTGEQLMRPQTMPALSSSLRYR